MPKRSIPPAVIRLCTRIVLIVVILVISGSIYAYLAATAGEIAASQNTAEPMKVPVFEVRKLPVQRQWLGQGVADAVNTADVPARINATIVKIPNNIQAGETVAKDQLLVELDASDFERQVAQQRNTLASIAAERSLLDVEQQRLKDRLTLAEEDAELAETEAVRVAELFKNGAAGQQDKDRSRRTAIVADQTVVQLREALEKIPARIAQLEARRDAQEASLRLSELNLERTQVASPIAGVLQTVDVEVGENVTAGMRLTRVVNLDNIEVALKLPSGARSTVMIGDPVTLQSVSNQGRTWQGVVGRIAPEDDPRSRTLTVYVNVEQAGVTMNHRLAPGTFLTGTVTNSQTEQRFAVPARAIRAERLHVINDGLIETRDVQALYNIETPLPTTGLDDQQWVVLDDDGLTDGDLVMVNMSTSVLDGQRVNPVLPNGESLALPTPPTAASPIDTPKHSDKTSESGGGAM